MLLWSIESVAAIRRRCLALFICLTNLKIFILFVNYFCHCVAVAFSLSFSFVMYHSLQMRTFVYNNFVLLLFGTRSQLNAKLAKRKLVFRFVILKQSRIQKKKTAQILFDGYKI